MAQQACRSGQGATIETNQACSLRSMHGALQVQLWLAAAEQKRGGAGKSEAVAGVRKRRSGEGGGRRGQGGLQHEALADAPCSPRVGGRELASANARGQSGSLGTARIEALGSKHTARGAFFPPVASRRLRPHRRALATSSTLTIFRRGDAKRALCNERCTRGACSGGPPPRVLYC